MHLELGIFHSLAIPIISARRYIHAMLQTSFATWTPQKFIEQHLPLQCVENEIIHPGEPYWNYSWGVSYQNIQLRAGA